MAAVAIHVRRLSVRIPPVVPLKTVPTGLRKALAATAVTASASLLLADPASASWIAPETGGSPNADAIHSLYMILLVTGLIVFFAVEGPPDLHALEVSRQAAATRPSRSTATPSSRSASRPALRAS